MWANKDTPGGLTWGEPVCLSVCPMVVSTWPRSCRIFSCFPRFGGCKSDNGGDETEEMGDEICPSLVFYETWRVCGIGIFENVS